MFSTHGRDNSLAGFAFPGNDDFVRGIDVRQVDARFLLDFSVARPSTGAAIKYTLQKSSGASGDKPHMLANSIFRAKQTDPDRWGRSPSR